MDRRQHAQRKQFVQVRTVIRGVWFATHNVHDLTPSGRGAVETGLVPAGLE